MAQKKTSLSSFQLRGLIAATFTPFRADGGLHLARVKPVIDAVIAQGAAGLYVCGSTGEGPLLTTEERLLLAEASVKAAAGRVPVVVQVGHNSIVEARRIAAHAQTIGADAISATPPGYFKPDSMDTFLACMAEVAGGAPKLPFYYYHIPVLTGVRFDMIEFLRLGGSRIPTLRGIKFSDATLHEMLACIEFDGGRYDILFGIDEMLLAGLAFGARGAVGSTYNFAAPLYRRIIAAFERGDVAEARRWQSLSAAMVRIIIGNGGRGGLKAAMALVGADCGTSRLPTVTCTPAQRVKMKQELTELGFFDWTQP
ncbi:dihydrodipicolinate synthase family protein [Horticoccus sp. 23ND18S-11]|uniref:dihydrodipicolinate synthase family protein n=1 Tax=Horticoccus sp. 23ND18S-11 TaxID=3391832 RepID=UPI0039C981BE